MKCSPLVFENLVCSWFAGMFGRIVESLGDATSLGGVGHRGQDLRFDSQTLLRDLRRYEQAAAASTASTPGRAVSC